MHIDYIITAKDSLGVCARKHPLNTPMHAYTHIIFRPVSFMPYDEPCWGLYRFLFLLYGVHMPFMLQWRQSGLKSGHLGVVDQGLTTGESEFENWGRGS